MSKKEFENIEKLSRICIEVSAEVIPVFLDRMTKTLEKHKSGHISMDDTPEFLYTMFMSMSSIFLEHLEYSAMFKQFQDNNYKINLMEDVITKQMTILAGLKEKRAYV